MTRTPCPLALAFLLLSLFAGSAGAQQASPQSAPPAAPAVSVSTTPSGVRFVAVGAVSTRLEVYDASGAAVFDSKLRGGNVSDWAARGSGLSDGAYTCVLTVRDVAGRFHLKQATILLRGGEASLALGEAEAAKGAAQAKEGGGAATLSTHDGRDGALTSTQGALTLRTGDVLSGGEREHVRVTEDGRVGIGTDKPEETLDVAGAVRAQGGFKFPDGSTLQSRGGRLTLTAASGEELPTSAAATGTGTQNRLAKWAETGGAGTLTDSVVAESAGNIGVGTASPTGKFHLHAGAGQAADVRMTNDSISSPFTFGGALPNNLGARFTFAAVNEGGLAAQGFTDANSPAFRFQGHVGATAPTHFPVIFEGFKSNGAGDRAPLGAAERVFGFYNGAFDSGGAVLLAMTGGGDVGIGTTTPTARLHVANTQPPPAASGPGANAPPVLNVVGAKGGNALSQGPIAGTGSDVVVQAGAGGDQFSGSTGVRGGNILLQAGAGGNNPGQHAGPGGSITLQPGLGGDGIEAGGPDYDGPHGKVLLAPTAGRVGVGTAAPEAALHVVGPGGVSETSSAALLNAPPALKVVGGKGGDDFNAGQGADVHIQAGDGGARTSTSGLNGLGGSITLQPGTGGGGIVAGGHGVVALAPSVGNVGVGTEFPSFKLDVRGDARVDGQLWLDSLLTDTLQTTDLTGFRDLTIDFDTLRVDGLKNLVGVGTHEPKSRLHVVGSFAQMGTGTVTSSGQSVSGSGTNFSSVLASGDTISAGGQSRTVFAVGSNSSLTVTEPFSPNVSGQQFFITKSIFRLADASGSLRAIMSADGSFGIGFVPPENPFQVDAHGTAVGGSGGLNEVVGRFRHSSHSEHSAVSIDSASSRDSILYFAKGESAVWGLRNDADDGDKFQLRHHGGGANTPVLTARANGHLGIGTNAPGNLLHVSGAGTASGGCCGATPAAQEVVGHFVQPSDANHSAISVDASGATGGNPSGRDSILYFAKGGTAIWGFRNDADAGDKFQLRYHGDGGFADDVSRFTVLPNGNVGLGTNSPAQRLEVKGGVRLATSDAAPACDATTRGTFWVTQGASGVKDTVAVCAKDAANTYAWRVLY